MVLGLFSKFTSPLLPATRGCWFTSVGLCKAQVLLLFRYALVLAGGVRAASGVIYHAVATRVCRSLGLTRPPAALLGCRRVRAPFDGFFFPLKTHEGPNLFYFTPARRRKPRRAQPGRFRLLKHPRALHPGQPQRRAAFSSLRPALSFGLRPVQRTPQQRAARFRHYRGLLGSFTLTTQPVDVTAPLEGACGPAFDTGPTAPRNRTPRLFDDTGRYDFATHPLTHPWFQHTRGASIHSLKEKIARRGASPFASYEAAMSRWSLIAARFRPGLSTEWRRCRRAFNQAWGLGFARQHRLTRFVLSLRHFWGFSFLRVLSLSLGRLARLSYLSFGFMAADLSHFVKGGGWSINGVCANNPFLQVFVGDYISPLSDPRVISGGSGVLYDQVSLLRYYKYLQLQGLTDSPLALAIDTPPFLEVDELTTAASLLYEPRGTDLFLDPQVGAAPYLTVRMYNWKYTT